MRISAVVKSFVIMVVALVFAACASAPKGEISSSANPKEEIERLSADLGVAQKSNIDILARKEFQNSNKFLVKAKQDLSDGKEQEKVIDDLRYGRESLKAAYTTAGNHKDKLSGLFEARQNAIMAGATQSSELKKEWSNLDEDVAANVDRNEIMATKEVSEFQTRYMELEKKAVVGIQLGDAKAEINGAKNNDGKDRAPKTLRKAEISVKNAESLIGANISNPAGYSQAVTEANYDAKYLADVMATMKQNGKSLSESAALSMVSQRRQITGLQKDLTTSAGEISDVESKLDSKNKALANKEMDLQNKDNALGAAQASVAVQRAMERSRQQFLSSEAETYQQGDNLLIRLKTINFPVGQSALPTQSMGILAKVSDVAKSLNAKEIKVEGHTDSTGTSEINQKISEQRASAVATYFRTNGFEDTQVLSEGHGFENPIATNKSKAGRALNRRVDIIITPDRTAKTTQ
jgi:OmpA-OmpF porin, OOP family